MTATNEPGPGKPQLHVMAPVMAMTWRTNVLLDSVFGLALLGGAIWVGFEAGILLGLLAGLGAVIFVGWLLWTLKNVEGKEATRLSITDQEIDAETMIKGRGVSVGWNDVDVVKRYTRKGEVVRLDLISTSKREKIILLGLRDTQYTTLPGLSDFGQLVDSVEKYAGHARWVERRR